jgi:hypothetical protein
LLIVLAATPSRAARPGGRRGAGLRHQLLDRAELGQPGRRERRALDGGGAHAPRSRSNSSPGGAGRRRLGLLIVPKASRQVGQSGAAPPSACHPRTGTRGSPGAKGSKSRSKGSSHAGSHRRPTMPHPARRRATCSIRAARLWGRICVFPKIRCRRWGRPPRRRRGALHGPLPVASASAYRRRISARHDAGRAASLPWTLKMGQPPFSASR